MLVEHLLCMSHELTQPLCIAGSHILDGLVHNIVVPLTQCLMEVLFGFCRGKGVGLVQVRQNPDGVLLGTQVGKHPI